MEYLSDDQLALLTKIAKLSTICYENLSSSEKSLCSYLESKSLVSFEKECRSKTFSGVFQAYFDIVSASITEEGNAYLKKHEMNIAKEESIRDQKDAISEISKNLNKQVEFAVKEANDAKRDAAFSKMISVLSALTALAALFM
ncbi:hypothetical protein [Eubacterium maltosivorans]|uniref:hypothetical protein n=1 Tax=Eubacterium maltosivorans TaxID=2041044 RepID=UPI00189ECD2F|nr:hypothetical protein [Eubacterium maltosivorans]